MSLLINTNATIFDTWAFRRPWPISLSTATTIVLGITLILLRALFSTKKPGSIKALGGLSILTAWPFFKKRHDFLKSNFLRVGEEMFTFNVLQHSVTAMRGRDARKAFFDNKSFDFIEGYKILMGAAPRLEDIDKKNDNQEDVSWFNKQLLLLLSRDRLSEILPSLFDDVQARMDNWGKTGKFDPFRNIWDLVFQMTVRMATCRELSSDLDIINQVQGLYWSLEKSATPTSLLLPWFPGADKKRKEAATRKLFTILYGYVEQRRAADVPNSDAIDVMIGQGLTNESIIGFILGVVFAGVINTGINSCWALLFLAHNKEWKKKVAEEVHLLIDKHTNTTSSEPLHKRLSAIPVRVWDEEMPILDTVLRETIRIVLNGAVLRRNVDEDLGIAGKTLPKGHFVTYPIYDAHLNPDIYPNPTIFDPDRFSPGREEDKKETYAYLGWGAGRHPCTGIKVAKLEMKILIALFVAAYDYDVVDEAGNFPESLPKPNYNDIQQARPVGEPCYLKFNRVVE